MHDPMTTADPMTRISGHEHEHRIRAIAELSCARDALDRVAEIVDEASRDIAPEHVDEIQESRTYLRLAHENLDEIADALGAPCGLARVLPTMQEIIENHDHDGTHLTRAGRELLVLALVDVREAAKTDETR